MRAAGAERMEVRREERVRRVVVREVVRAVEVAWRVRMRWWLSWWVDTRGWGVLAVGWEGGEGGREKGEMDVTDVD